MTLQQVIVIFNVCIISTMKTLTVNALVFVIVALARADAGAQLVKHSAFCPRDWTAIGSRCFRYVPKKLTWARAEQNCVTMGANLASVHDATENLAIQTLIAKITHGYGETWLGGSDCQKEGTWLWSDGTPFSYRHCGEFDNRWWKQHCLQMNFGANKCWDDVQCSSKRPSICAKNPQWI